MTLRSRARTAAAHSLCLLALGSTAWAAPLGVLTGVQGRVEVHHGAAVVPAHDGSTLNPGDTIVVVSGQATVFLLGQPPRQLGPGAHFAPGAATGTSGGSVWSAVANGLAQGLAAPNHRIAATMRPGTLLAAAPVNTALPVSPASLSAEIGALDPGEITGYKFEIRTAAGAVVQTIPSANLVCPLTVPLPPGDYEWRAIPQTPGTPAVPPATPPAPGAPEPAPPAPVDREDWATPWTDFSVASSADAATLQRDLGSLDAGLADAPEDQRQLARAALLSDRGYLSAAAGEIIGQNSPPARALLVSIYTRTGQTNLLDALDAAPLPPPDAGDALTLPIEVTSEQLPPDAVHRFVDPLGHFELTIPMSWGVMALALPPGIYFYQFGASLGATPSFSVSFTDPAVLGDKSILEDEAAAMSKAGQFVYAAPDQVAWRGAQAAHSSWSFDGTTIHTKGECWEWRENGQEWLLSVSGTDPASLEYRQARSLLASFQAGPVPKGPPLLRDGEAFVREVQPVVRSGTVMTQAREDMDSDSEPSSVFETKDAQRAAAPPNSQERAGFAHAAALAAGNRAWDAQAAGHWDEAQRWFLKRAELEQESVDAEVAFYQGQIAATDARYAVLRARVPVLQVAGLYSTLMGIMLSTQANRAKELETVCEANSRSDLGINFARQEYLWQSEALHKLALSGTDPSQITAERAEMATALNNLALAYDWNAQFDLARAYYLRAMDWKESLPPDSAERDLSNSYRELALLAAETGDPVTARSEYEKSLQALDVEKPFKEKEAEEPRYATMAELSKAEFAQRYALDYNNLGILCEDSGDYGAAQKDFDLALDAVKDIPGGGYPGSIRDFMTATTTGNLASYEADIGETADSELLMQKSLDLRRALGDQAGLALGLVNLGLLEEAKGHYAGALTEVQEARALLAQVHDTARMIAADICLSRLERKLGHLPLADQLATSALKEARDFHDDSTIATADCALARIRIAELPSPPAVSTPARLAPVYALLDDSGQRTARTGEVVTVIETFGLRASAKEQEGDLESARLCLQNAIARLETVRGTLTSSDSFSDVKSNYELYGEMVKVLLKLHRADEAFDYLSRARSKKLGDELRLSSLHAHDPALQALLDRAAALETQLGTLRSALATEKALPEPQRDPDRLANLQNLVASTQEEFFTVSEQIKAKNPNYDHVLSVKPRELKKAQRAIPEDAVLVQYAPLGDSLYVFVVTREDLKIFDLPVPADELDRRVRAYRSAMDAEAETVRSGAELPSIDQPGPLRDASTGLYDLLITPIAGSIADKKTIAFIPTGTLFYLPFHALAHMTPSGLKFLAEEKQVAYLAAADVLSVVQPRDASQWGNGVLALGDPTGANLPAARDEVSAIAKLIPASRALTDDGATKAALMLPANLQHRVVHLAAHGVLDSLHPDQSYIQLAPSGTDDGKLRMGEIYGLDMDRVDLVTLSACQTALGEGQPDGSEISSLAESFSSAGTPSVVASLWSVEDTSTRTLMEKFYSSLAGGASKAEALQTAQLALIHDPATRNPFYWAPFELLGDWR